MHMILKRKRLTPGYMEWVCLRLLGIKGYKDMELWCGISRQPDIVIDKETLELIRIFS